MDRGLRSNISRRFFQISFTVFLVGAILFISAGTVNWLMAWLYLAAVIVILAASGIGMLRANPQLVGDRSQPQEGTPTWDRILLIVYGVLGYIELGVAGLDRRYGCTPEFPLWISLVALLIFTAADFFSVWAMLTNAHFETTVRIQDDKGHQVIEDGPYRFVRHPGYAGWSLCHLLTPFILSSWYAYIPVSLVFIILVIRTGNEDRTLQAELPGYNDYAARTRYRLLPGVW